MQNQEESEMFQQVNIEITSKANSTWKQFKATFVPHKWTCTLEKSIWWHYSDLSTSTRTLQNPQILRSKKYPQKSWDLGPKQWDLQKYFKTRGSQC